MFIQIMKKICICWTLFTKLFFWVFLFLLAMVMKIVVPCSTGVRFMMWTLFLMIPMTFFNKGGVPSKSWSVPRTGYSYSDNAQINQYDILEDNTATDVIPRTVPSNHTDDVLRQNIVNSLKQSLKHGMVTHAVPYNLQEDWY